MDDNPGFPAVFLGAMRIGAVPVPVNPLYGAGLPLLRRGQRRAARGRRCGVRREGASAEAVAGRRAKPSDELQPVDTLRDDVAFWLYSSGSTGRPKGVVHPHRDLLFTCETYARHVLGIPDHAVTFSTTKLFHAYGLGNNLSFPYWAGATTVPPERSSDARRRSSRWSRGSAPRSSSRCRRSTTPCSRPSATGLLVGSVLRLGRRAASRRGLAPVARRVRPRDPRRRSARPRCCTSTARTPPGTLRPARAAGPVPGYDVKLVDDDGDVVDGTGSGDLYVRGESMLASTGTSPRRRPTASATVGSTPRPYRRDERAATGARAAPTTCSR